MNVEAYLETFEQRTKDPSLNAMIFLMKKFGDPHKKVKTIHIAGTNGKGSVCEMLSNILMKAGYKTAKFMSPYLLKFNERLVINDREIASEDTEKILEKMKIYIDEYNEKNEIKVKWFEVITSLAYIYYAEQKCDFAVIEAGMGGTWDCTNIIEPEISVITKIGYDHIDLLGDTIEKIARNKAGIIKENSNTVFVDQENIIEIIKEVCNKKNNKLHLINSNNISNYEYNIDFGKFDYKKYKNIKINLQGKAQTLNASECLECVDILREKGYKISEEAVREGLSTVVHKGRLEILSKSPLIIFDGGHNEDAIINLRENVEAYYKNFENKKYIVSLLKTKDYKTIIKNLCKNNDGTFIFTNGIDNEKYVSNEDLYNEAKKYIEENKIFKEELDKAIKEIKNKDVATFIVGSFYVYKKTRELLENV